MRRSSRSVSQARDPAIEDVLGTLGAAVMRIVWAGGESSVSTVLKALNAERVRPLAYTTVMTIAVRLWERGLLVREKRGRQFVYRPTSDEGELMESLSAREIDRLLERYGTTALRQFATRLADVDTEVLRRTEDLARRPSQ
jgi:predicted transcriptional regulator